MSRPSEFLAPSKAFMRSCFRNDVEKAGTVSTRSNTNGTLISLLSCCLYYNAMGRIHPKFIHFVVACLLLFVVFDAVDHEPTPRLGEYR